MTQNILINKPYFLDNICELLRRIVHKLFFIDEKSFLVHLWQYIYLISILGSDFYYKNITEYNCIFIEEYNYYSAILGTVKQPIHWTSLQFKFNFNFLNQNVYLEDIGFKLL